MTYSPIQFDLSDIDAAFERVESLTPDTNPTISVGDYVTLSDRSAGFDTGHVVKIDLDGIYVATADKATNRMWWPQVDFPVSPSRVTKLERKRDKVTHETVTLDDGREMTVKTLESDWFVVWEK